MSSGSNAIQTVQSILEWHRRGTSDRMHTVQLLGTLFNKMADGEKNEICEYLESVLRSEPLEDRIVKGIGVNMPLVALAALARFGPNSRLPDAVFSRLKRDNVPQMEGWAKYWCPVLKSCLFQNGDRIPVSVLADLRARSDAYQKLVPPSTLFLDALKDLDAAVDRLELEKFEKALIETPDMAGEGSNELKSNGATTDVNPEIWKALKEAQDHLHGAGQFDPKKAADLLRSSLDETHRVLVHEMEKITGKQYQGGEKDGARRQYLRDIGFISLPEEKFLTAIYALISEEASHKLIAPRETVFVLLTTVRGFIQLLSKRLHDRKVPTG